MGRTSSAFEVEGVRELRAALRQTQTGMKDLRTVYAAAAQVPVPMARSLVRVRSGKMRSTIRSSGQQSAGVIRIGNASTPWAPVQYFGWAGHNISPSPSLATAAHRQQPAIIDTFERGVDGIIHKHL